MTTALRPVWQPVPPPLGLVAHLHRRTGEAVQRMLAAFVAEIPFYGRIPREQLQDEIAQICRDNLADFGRCCREGRLPSSDELLAARAGAARRAEEGVPLDAVLMAYTTGNRITWEVLAEAVAADEQHLVTAFTPYLQRYLQVMLHSVTSAYVEERRSIEHDEGSAWRTLVDAVLEGRPAADLADRLGVPLADSYLVLGLHLPVVADEDADGVDPLVAARRKVRRVRAVVDGLPGSSPSLASLSPTGGVVLVPGVGQRLPGRAETGRAVTLMSQAAGAPATAVGVAATSLAQVPAAAALARRLVQLALTLARPPGTYLMEDLALEHQMALEGPTRSHLAAQVRPLLAHADLLPTLRCWLAHDRSRREAAEELHVHPNTLDKRLERVAQLTGVDVSTTRGVALLHAGLVALEVEQACGTSPVRP